MNTELADMLEFFKALSDESRLKIIGALSNCERTVEELSTMLDLKAPTVSHHLARLKALQLVEMRAEGNTHLYRLNITPLKTLSKQLLSVQSLAIEDDSINYDAWEKKILSDFFEGQKLKEIPASRKKREVILKWLVNRFDEKRSYPEKEVNKIIMRHHPDFATLRRELICAKLMSRKDGIYQRCTPKNSGG